MANEKTLSKANIQKEREALLQRLADLDAAERVIDSLTPAASKTVDFTALSGAAFPTIRETILHFLAQTPSTGRTTGDIGDYLRQVWKNDYPNRFISPKLSMYKSDGDLTYQNGLWFITPAGHRSLLLTEKSKD
ncbi:MAG: hypothetical protein KF826_14375 [Xanthobacteraceae bacterium]|nr:hypothetical protein [Xanthobacteraceae bacterium]MBX3548219.1 hypothetical protein [Xanthobacteraceae bacterium]MCW5675804.1 hypothetical protein [Xanthobacteraceae bacterium]MCW5679148.1 hypothetical protein [Xanthobacteraceae bacterium]